MRFIEYSYPQKTNTKNLAVALGYFDGVHIGHRKLIKELVNYAGKNNLTPCVFTFSNPPSKTKNTQTLIYNNQEKAALLESLGVKIIFSVNFSSVCSLFPEDFVNEVLIKKIGAEMCVAGFNFRFGYKASGKASDLAKIMADNGKKTIIIDEQTQNGKTLSSTEIRALLSSKQIEQANEMLGVPYFIHGIVEKGLGLGKHFGFPTVNTPTRDDSPLPVGVYRTAVRIKDRLYTGITNIGHCPTVEMRNVHAETLIADFNGDLYGEEIFIYILEYLRDERKFDSVDELREQIYRDRDISVNKNGDLKWLATGLNLP